MNERIMNEGILSAVGETPLVRLNQFVENLHFRLFAKVEGLNPGGSVKDRPARKILEHGIETGTIGPDTVIIESSSGNMGIGLAQACAFFGLRLICVVDPKTTEQNVLLMKAYGAEVDLVAEPDAEGEFLKPRIDRVKTLAARIENSFWPNQYANTLNATAHHQTMHEIATALEGEVDYLFCATSTCGTLRGCAEYINQAGLQTRIVAVDALGSVIFSAPKHKRLIPGHGAAVVPQLFKRDLANECIHVSDLDCVVGCRRLARREAILAGGSSGAVVMAVLKALDRIRENTNCVVILPDRGERYLDTIYSDVWVEEHFGDVSDLWSNDVETDVWMTAA
jgi:N-(2-amino-2-carboxyethyl)-L-glutamate synthase